jgi:hypothetical protein
MKRATMVVVGGVVGLAFAIAILGLFVHRPSECGEPAACGDAHLFPAIYFAGAAFVSTVVVSATKRGAGATSWRRFSVVMGLWAALLALALVTARAVVG